MRLPADGRVARGVPPSTDRAREAIAQPTYATLRECPNRHFRMQCGPIGVHVLGHPALPNRTPAMCGLGCRVEERRTTRLCAPMLALCRRLICAEIAMTNERGAICRRSECTCQRGWYGSVDVPSRVRCTTDCHRMCGTVPTPGHRAWSPRKEWLPCLFVFLRLLQRSPSPRRSDSPGPPMPLQPPRPWARRRRRLRALARSLPT